MEMLCIDFLNSEFRDFRGRWVEDRLYHPQWVEEFCKRWGLHVATLPDAATLKAFTTMRSSLRIMVETIARGQELSYQQLAELNSILVMTPVVRHLMRGDQQVVQYQRELIPLEKNWNWVKTEIASSFADLLAFYDLRRLKICANAHSRAVFYDESKNRTRTLCSEKCSNLLKAQRFHARHLDK